MRYSRLNSLVKAFASTKSELLVSLEIVLLLTILLSVIFYSVESKAQPQVFSSYSDAFVWAYTRYIEGGDGVFDGNPVTALGKLIASMVGFIGIAIVAIPAGLISSGFINAMNEDKRQQALQMFRQEILHKFRRKRDMNLKTYFFVPKYLSLKKIQIECNLTENDIFDTVRSVPLQMKDIKEGTFLLPGYRFRNLADIQDPNSVPPPQDQVVIEHFLINRRYGLFVDRKSPVTIVVPTCKRPIGNFPFYLALMGGFNYISKELDSDPRNPISFNDFSSYDMEDDVLAAEFLKDLRSISKDRDNNNWVIFVNSSGRLQFSTGSVVRLKYSEYCKETSTNYYSVHDIDTADEFCNSISSLLEKTYQHKMERWERITGDDVAWCSGDREDFDRRHHGKPGDGQLSICNESVNAMTLYLDWDITFRDDRSYAIARDLALQMQSSFMLQVQPQIHNEQLLMKRANGYNDYLNEF